MTNLKSMLREVVKGFNYQSKLEFTHDVIVAANTKSEDLCWCQSGKIFGACHEHRTDERLLNEHEIRIAISKIFDSKKYCCASFDASNCELPIKGAHTIQRGRVLSSLAESGHVGTFYRNITGFEETQKLRTGIKKEASIFYGFCHYHDTELFKAIELEEFSLSSSNAWASSYRAVCHEFYQKRAAIDVIKWQRENLDKGLELYEQILIQEKLHINNINVRKGFEDIECIKIAYEKAFVNNEFNRVTSYVIKFDAPLTIAVCASISPYYDLSHNRMQNKGNPHDNFQHIALSTVTIDGNAAYVISYLSEHTVIDGYVRELISKGNAFVKSWLMKSIFAYTENCFFRLSWWSSLPINVQERIYTLAISENYTEPFEYDDLVASNVTGDIVEIISI
ncbi:TPA: hypothetical protein ACGVBR_002653 [Vibrio vulnificus]